MKRRERIVLIAFAVLDVVLLAVCLRSGFSVTAIDITLLSAAYASLGLVSLRLPRGDALHGGIGLAIASLFIVGGCGTMVVVTLGGIGAAVIANRADEDEGLGLDLIRQPALVALTAWLWSLTDPLTASANSSTAMLIFVLVGLVYVVLDILSYAVLSAYTRKERVFTGIMSFTRLVSGIYLGLGSVGVALALVVDASSPAASLIGGLVLLALMLIMKYNFGLFLQIRTAYNRTVAVLARLAEIGSEQSRGHAERVADIATSVGRRLHMSHRELEQLNLAALLHAVGKVQSSAGTDDAMDEAAAAARIAERVPFLAPVAGIVELHHCGPEESETNREAYLAHVVGMSCAFDQMVTSESGPHAESQAMASLRARPQEYAPSLVRALGESRGIPAK